MFSSTSFAEWTKVSEDVDGNIHYMDFERIRKHDGFVYYWTLSDLLKPDKEGDLSYKHYRQTDCKLFRYKNLSNSYHKEPMGGGIGEVNNLESEWTYPTPNSVFETMLKITCGG